MRPLHAPGRIGLALTASLAIGGTAMVGGPTVALGATGDDEIAITVIEQNTPAVVTIQTPASSLASNDVDEPAFSEGFDVPGRFQLPGGTGSGIVISSDGLIITNGHVVGNADVVDVILDDGRVLTGTVTGADTLTDLAFVDVEATDLPTATVGGSSDLRVGQLAISIGNPLRQYPGSASVGIVSGLERSISVFGTGRGGSP